MAGIYVDTSALGRVLLGEPDASSIRARLARFDPWYASELLVVELRRLGRREGVLPRAERTIAAVNLVPLTRALLERTSRLEPVDVRSLDVIHLCTAVDLHTGGSIAAVLTYDRSPTIASFGLVAPITGSPSRHRRPEPTSASPSQATAATATRISAVVGPHPPDSLAARMGLDRPVSVHAA